MTTRPRGRHLLVAALLLTGAATAEGTRLELQPASEVLLAGSTNVHAWRCATQTLSGELRLDADPRRVLAIVERLERSAAGGTLPAAEIPGGFDAELALDVPIAALACGNRAMERDLQRTLDAERHPVIRYRFAAIDGVRVERGADGVAFELAVRGTMSIAGTTRPVAFTVTGRRSGRHAFRLAGRVPLSMTDFGIAPPTALLGLIRVDDRLSVEVDLLLDLDAASAAELGR